MPTQRDVERLQALREAKRRGVLGPIQSEAVGELESRFSQYLKEVIDRAKSVVEPAMTAVSASIAEPVSGLVGLSALPFGTDVASRAIENTQDAMTYQPRTEAGRQGLQGLQELMAPVGEAFEGASSYLGDAAYEATGSPAAGAAAYSIPALGLDLLGLKGTRAASKAGKLGRRLEVGDIGSQMFGQRGAVGGVKGVDIPDMPEGRVMNAEPGSKLTFVETPDGKVQMYNPNREKWTDVTESPIAENVRRKDAEIQAAGGVDEYQRSIEDIRKQRAEAVRQYREEVAQQGETYKMQHTAPMLDDNPSGSDLSSVMPDVYRPDAKQYHGTGASYDDKALNVIRRMKGRPNADVTVYRAVPEGVDGINPGDWVTTTKEYARDHIGNDEGYKIISKKVKAKELANDGNSIHEFGFDPGKR